MVDKVRLECSGDGGVLVLDGGRVGGSDGRVGGSRFNAVDSDVAVSPTSTDATPAIRIGYIFVFHSSRNFEPEKFLVEVCYWELSF